MKALREQQKPTQVEEALEAAHLEIERLEKAAADAEAALARYRDVFPKGHHWPGTMRVYDPASDSFRTLSDLRRLTRRGQLIPFVVVPDGN